MLLNLTSFVEAPWKSERTFDFEKFAEVTRRAQRLMDNMVDLEIEQVDKIISKINNDPESQETKAIELQLWTKIKEQALLGRRTGLGITGLGDTLAMLNIQYGSDESIELTEEIYRTLAVNAYRSSIIMAKERGAFKVFNATKEEGHPFLERIWGEDPELKVMNQKHGRRNIALTTTAPAGSVSVLTQTTSGIEPAYMLHYTRRKKLTGQDEEARVDFIDESGDKWQEYIVYHHGFKKWIEQSIFQNDNEPSEMAELSPYKCSTATEIDWIAKVKMQAVAQKWVCHAISNTTNLPSDADIETVKQVYMAGWDRGCKGITVYRDGSRTGVLVSNEKKQSDPRECGEIITKNAPKRPEEMECDIHQANIKGEAWTILIGLMKGKPYEVIGGLSEYVEIPRKYQSGRIRRRSRKSVNSKYDLIVGTNGDEFVIKDVVKVFDNPNHSAFTRTISLALRHGVPVQYMVEQLHKDKDADLFSFAKVTARCLKKYIADGTRAGNGVFDKACCDNPNIIYQEGCATCVNCGMAKCG
jgi:ribonucleoside-diphosphate reductase alpha chain